MMQSAPGKRTLKRRMQRQRAKTRSSAPALSRVAFRNVAEFRTNITCTNGDLNGSATTAQAYSFYLNYPTYFRNPAATNAQMANVPSAYANEFKMFDEYKVHSLTVEYIPFMTYQNLAAATTVTDPTMVLATDNDDAALLTSYAKAINSQGRALYSILNTNGRSLVITQLNEGANAAQRWGNTGSPSPSAVDAVTPLKLSSIKAYVAQYAASNQIRGLWVATWNVSYRGVFTSQ